MKQLKFLSCLFSLMLIGILVSCSTEQEKTNTEEIVQEKVEDTIVKIENGKIMSAFSALPDASINMETATAHFAKFPERWNTVFKYLIDSDLTTLPVGRQDLSDDVFVIVSDYDTKSLEEGRFESHKQYIDLQYVVSGEEVIGLTNDTTITIETPYSEADDIMFYDFDGGQLLPALPSNYFIFFPEDKHKPGLSPQDGKKQVRKIVFKVKYE